MPVTTADLETTTAFDPALGQGADDAPSADRSPAHEPAPESAVRKTSATDCAPHCSIPLTTPRLSHDQATQLSSVFKALAHPTRVQLMNLLVSSPFAVCAYDLQVAMGMAQSTISHHLKLVVGAGLVHRQQRGIWAYYSINVDAMRALGIVISLDDAAPQPLSPAALRDPAVERSGDRLDDTP